jgi:predicted dehydrogenase
MRPRIRVGVIGCGLIAQVMHLPYLSELDERYELVAVCDLSEEVARGCAQRYGVERVHTSWEALLQEELDAVLILTSGDHAPIAVAAAQRGLHVLLEKPMSLWSAGAEAAIAAARAAGTRLMVGTMKRYDPAYERLSERLAAMAEPPVLVSVTTLEAPMQPFVGHYPMVTGAPPAADVLERLNGHDERLLAESFPELDEDTRWCYRWILLDCLIHELNALRGLFGPGSVVSADLTRTCVNLHLRFGGVPCHLSWVELPALGRYRQDFAIYAPGERLTLSFPSPFLRSMPTRLVTEGGTAGIFSYEEAFKRELVAFADSIESGRDPRTDGEDGLADIRLCEEIARSSAPRHSELRSA